MNILTDIYKRSLLENEKNVRFWEEYLQNLISLKFDVYSEQLSVPVLVPVGNRILFRGSLKHTNEVTIALGADYFAKCSIKQAETLRQHRIKDAKSKLETYNKEKEYLENQLIFGKQNVYGNAEQDIIEVYIEEEDKRWREQHRERVKQYHQSADKKKENSNKDVSDEELWMRLEELELQEELENEMDKLDTADDVETYKSDFDSYVIKESDVRDIESENISSESESTITHNVPKQTSKTDLLQQVIDRQKLLETKLTEFKNRDRPPTKTKSELLSRLEEIEKLDALEDDMERLEDILDGGKDEDSTTSDAGKDEDSTKSDAGKDEDSTKSDTLKSSKTVAFADEDNAETLKLTFSHSDVKPSRTPYDPKHGIRKPSDVYVAYPNLFSHGRASILRKSKYSKNQKNVVPESDAAVKANRKNREREVETQEIIMKEVIEQSNSRLKVVVSLRPLSLFKQKRQHKS